MTQTPKILVKKYWDRNRFVSHSMKATCEVIGSRRSHKVINVYDHCFLLQIHVITLNVPHLRSSIRQMETKNILKILYLVKINIVLRQWVKRMVHNATCRIHAYPTQNLPRQKWSELRVLIHVIQYSKL